MMIPQKFLTERGFIHRDLSTRNVLIGDRLNVKITNPGIHMHYNDTHSNTVLLTKQVL